jgi:hypothetical protein
MYRRALHLSRRRDPHGLYSSLNTAALRTLGPQAISSCRLRSETNGWQDPLSRPTSSLDLATNAGYPNLHLQLPQAELFYLLFLRYQDTLSIYPFKKG